MSQFTCKNIGFSRLFFFLCTQFGSSSSCRHRRRHCPVLSRRRVTHPARPLATHLDIIVLSKCSACLDVHTSFGCVLMSVVESTNGKLWSNLHFHHITLLLPPTVGPARERVVAPVPPPSLPPCLLPHAVLYDLTCAQTLADFDYDFRDDNFILFGTFSAFSFLVASVTPLLPSNIPNRWLGAWL